MFNAIIKKIKQIRDNLWNRIQRVRVNGLYNDTIYVTVDVPQTDLLSILSKYPRSSDVDDTLVIDVSLTLAQEKLNRYLWAVYEYPKEILSHMNIVPNDHKMTICFNQRFIQKVQVQKYHTWQKHIYSIFRKLKNSVSYQNTIRHQILLYIHYIYMNVVKR